MLLISIDTDYRRALALCFERFAARGRALRLLETAPSFDLAGTQDEAAGDPHSEEANHGDYPTESNQFISDMQDPAEQPIMAETSGGPQESGASSNADGIECARVGSGYLDPGSQSN
jgi:hypothetical protein